MATEKYDVLAQAAAMVVVLAVAVASSLWLVAVAVGHKVGTPGIT